MSFVISLSADHIRVEPGSVTPITLSIQNSQDCLEQYEIFIEGIDPDWVALPSSLPQVHSGETSTEKILFRPSRNSETLAGTYPLVLSIRALSTGYTQKAHLLLEVNPFYYVSIDLTPKKGKVNVFKSDDEFRITLMNLGNSDQSLQLFGADSDNACTFAFDQSQIHITPGQQKEVIVRVGVTSKPLFSTTKLRSFSIVARSQQNSTSVGTAQGQIEIHALTSPTGLVIGTALAGLFTAWIMMIPKPPVIEHFNIDKHEITLGESIQLNWKASAGTKSVLITQGQEKLFQTVGEKGIRIFTPKIPGSYELQAFALRGNLKSEAETLQLEVKSPIQVPDPKILEFAISPNDIKMGQPFVVTYRCNPSTVKASLAPAGINLDLKMNEIELKATRTGDLQYTLIAENATGIHTQKSITLHVTEPSAASIILFRAEQSTDTPNRFSLEWQLNDAVRAEIKFKNKIIEVIPTSGTREVEIEQKEEKITLIAYDKEGKTTQKEIILKGETQ